MRRIIRSAIVLLLIVAVRVSYAQIEHVEPQNWWVGMKNPKLQVLIHGKDIAETTPQIKYEGVLLQKVNKADNKNYLFLDLMITPKAKAGVMDIVFKKGSKVVVTYKYSLLKRNQDPAQLKGFSASDVLYLITPDRFVNGDYANDVVAGMRENKINRPFDGGRHGGDIRGIINSLDYLQQLGVTAIWPQPLLENDMDDYSYHGYAITHHSKVDPRYGTLEEYKELSLKAKQKGIKLIFDGVVNHIGSNHWFMLDRPFKDWINYSDSMVLTHHRRSIQQDMYASQYDKDVMTKGWFVPTMPDMNTQNPFMATYLIQNTIWWIETLQLGGIREDTYCYSNKNFLKDWSCSVLSEYPNFNIVGEEWSYNPLITSYWQQGKKRHDGYESCLKTVMDFPLQGNLIKALNNREVQDSGLTTLYETFANDFVYANPNSILVFGDNHDMDRIYTQLNQDEALTQNALTLLMTVRGIPQIYYGTEILMDNTPHFHNHGVIRSDFPGGWKEDKTNAFTGQGLTPKQLDFQNYVRKLLQWRKANPVIFNGKTLHFAPFGGYYVYFRYNNQKLIMVVLNKNTEPTRLETKRFKEILGTKTKFKEVFGTSSGNLSDGIPMSPKRAAVFEIE